MGRRGDEQHVEGTRVGNMASPWAPVVDRCGLVTPRLWGWSLDWWVGADDRWHLPAREPSVRQRLVGGAPVVETALRVPSGDALERVYGVQGEGDTELVVVEVENRSPVPFALALVIRPHNPENPGNRERAAVVKRISLTDRTIAVDGCPALLLPTAPRRVATSTSGAPDCESVVTGGRAGAPATFPARLRCRKGSAEAAFLFPLPHGATLRAAIPLVRGRRPRRTVGLPARLPTAADAARAWDVQTRRGMRLALPGGRLSEAVEANRRYLLLFAGHASHHRVPPEDAASLVRALDGYGFPAEAAEVRQSATLSASASSKNVNADKVGSLERLRAILDAASPTWAWPDDPHGATAAEFLARVRAMLVRETTDGGLALCPMLPEEWWGQGVEVHDAPTHAGRLSFAIRWHGERPALLWELILRGDARCGVRLTAPGLDRAWSSTEPAGEALLAAPAVSPARAPST